MIHQMLCELVALLDRRRLVGEDLYGTVMLYASHRLIANEVFGSVNWHELQTFLERSKSADMASVVIRRVEWEKDPKTGLHW
ncbi:hypothetical protein [Verrucomicrobium sp. 3C]|uniref:hypothetical protein n=1 Tax=Verrucomicrobium sp. 3C TaxID=1134055 RepID=UPI0012DF028F|nr:hypothetical protein [Verrucomicrobium sp. 3C]